MASWLRELFSGKPQKGAPAPQANSGKTKSDPSLATTNCRSCGAPVRLSRTTPEFGTALICPECKTPLFNVFEDQPGCPASWSPQDVQAAFGYTGCCLEHPSCAWCGKHAYAIVFPERGREVAWYSVQRPENPMADFAVQVDCQSCGRTFTVEWDGWPFPLDSRTLCCFCGNVVVGDTQPRAISDDKRAEFEHLLHQKASKMPYLHDGAGKPLWYACPACLERATRSLSQMQGTAPVQANGMGAELDGYVDELLRIDKTQGLLGPGRSADAGEDAPASYDSHNRHRRGREIGEVLCKRGGYDLMLRVAQAFVSRGGMEGHLAFCWHEIKDDAGRIVWLA